MKIRLNKAHYPVTSLGFGNRIGIWFQGCSIGCPGCVSRDTWDAGRSRETELELVLAWCRDTAGEECDGATISGGEPFQQPTALAALIDGLRDWRSDNAGGFDVLCYSGYPFNRLKKSHPEILARIDALIPEPYVATMPRGHLWRGSANQPLVLLSDLGKRRYAEFVDAVDAGNGRFQVCVDSDSVWCVGIPNRGDLERVEAAALARGIVLGAVSWRA